MMLDVGNMSLYMYMYVFSFESGEFDVRFNKVKITYNTTQYNTCQDNTRQG